MGNTTLQELNIRKAELIRAYQAHHLTWKELMEAINSLQLEALQVQPQKVA